jgi:type-F conjugative transfer system pilin assembly protein TrbC
MGMTLILITLPSLAMTDIKPQLLIFVSSSMPPPLLKTYYKEAMIYDGILVFKGLPNNSFQSLSELIINMQDNSASSIIDEELFEKFGIKNIPAFVLYKEEECYYDTSCKVTYDKVIGNIGVRSALEQFIENGDMKEYAIGLLK